ncbi:MAG: hypothetical protein WD887_01225 [Candidatus Saccharimonadales bacterium]
MIRLRETPVDERTGIPIALPLLPNGLEGIHSWHHAAHPKDHELLQDTGGMAVRCSRMQLVEGPGGTAALLNEANEVPDDTGIHPIYHRTYEGPLLPETKAQQFGYLIMMLADYIPEYGIDLSKNYPIERKIKPEEMKRLRSGELRVGSYSQIQDFFAEYLLDNGQGEFDSRDIDNFLSTPNGSYRFHFGNKLIGSAVVNAVQPWIRPYKQAKRDDLLRQDAPKSVHQLVQNAFGRETTRQGHIQRMYTRLSDLALQTEVDGVELAA